MFWRKRSAEDFAEEVKSHLELEADDLRREGMSDEEARRKARREFGNVRAAQEQFYIKGRWLWLDNLLRNIRFGLRVLIKNKGFTAVAIFALALGIGPTVAMFSIVWATFLAPLPYSHANELAVVWTKIKGERSPTRADDYLQYLALSKSFQRLDFKRRPADEEAADRKALELLKNSPYKEKLATAGLFLRALQQRAPDLPNLIRPHLGNGFSAGSNVRMEALLTSAPALDAQRIDQIAALPLGGRIKLDPWSDQVEMAKSQPVTLALAREKMPFEITPFFPYLTRLPNDHGDKVASAGAGAK